MKVLKSERSKIIDKVYTCKDVKPRVAEENVDIVFILVLVLPCWWYRDCRAKRFVWSADKGLSQAFATIAC